MLILWIQRLELVLSCIIVLHKSEIVLFLRSFGSLSSFGLVLGDDSRTPSSVEFFAGISLHALGLNLRWIDLKHRVLPKRAIESGNIKVGFWFSMILFELLGVKFLSFKSSSLVYGLLLHVVIELFFCLVKSMDSVHSTTDTISRILTSRLDFALDDLYALVSLLVLLHDFFGSLGLLAGSSLEFLLLLPLLLPG